MHRQLKMTFHAYLARLEKANPRIFAAKEIKMTPSSLIEQLQAAYRAGCYDSRGSELFAELFPPLSKKRNP